jgi:uncharacterized protein (TIGR03437 family)
VLAKLAAMIECCDLDILRGPDMITRSRLVFALACALVGSAHAQFIQQGGKLVGTGAVSVAGQGTSVALSADGNTAIVGGPDDNYNSTTFGHAGAAWVYTRSGNVWTQQGRKLVGTGAVGSARQGVSVALSADGNTAIVGGPDDNGRFGAAWVFTRSGSVWTQQGGKLVGAGAAGQTVQQGISVALSADGNTAIVGGQSDNYLAGAAWVFTRSGNVWTQQGSKLIGTGAVNAIQGHSVALSADGNTAIVGGPGDYGNGYSSGIGAAWVYTRSGGVWRQQGDKLIGIGAAGNAGQGSSVALAADGNTAIVSGTDDSSRFGAAWVFTRSGGAWAQQGNKLTGTGAAGNANQGVSVALSADGNTAIVGGPSDKTTAGAAWVYKPSGGVWTQQGSKLVGSGAVSGANQGTSVALSADGKTAIVGGPSDSSLAGSAWVFVDATPAGPQFTKDGIVNAASFQPGPNGGAIAPGEIITIFGTGAGPSQLTNGYDGARNVFANSVAGTEVLFDGVAAPIIYASSGQTTVITPYSLTGKSSTQVIISSQGVQSAAVTVAVVNFVPGIFTSLANGTGPAAAGNQDYSRNSSLNPEKRGNLVQVFMTVGGESGVDGTMASGAVFDNPQPTATIGGKDVQVVYAGPSPGSVWGLTQVNLYIPNDLPLSGSVPLSITYGGVTSQSNVTIAVAP